MTTETMLPEAMSRKMAASTASKTTSRLLWMFPPELVAFMKPRSKGPTVPASVWKNFLSFKRSWVRYS